MIYNNRVKLYLLSLSSIIYIVFTNSYFDYEQTLIFGAADGYSYYEISKYSPNIAEVALPPIHAERFLFPYLIGILSKVTSIEIYQLYRMIVFILIFLINYFIINNLEKLNIKLKISVFCVLLINFNPYLVRFYIANPLIINDLIFITGSLMCIKSIFKKEKKFLFIGLIVSCFARQSALAIIISIIFIKIFRRKKFFLSIKDIYFSVFIFIFIYLIGYYYSSIIPQSVARMEQYHAQFGLFIDKTHIKELVIFFVWPFLSFFPLIFFIFFYLNYKPNKFIKNIDVSLFIIFFSIPIIFQPIFQGVEVSGRNIIRLSSLSFIPILILSFINFNIKNEYIFIKSVILSAIILLWSSHPTFSKFSFLENFKF